MKTKTFTCKRCETIFEKVTKSYAYYCPECKKKVNSESVMRSRKKYNPEVKIGVGSGGNQEGSKNPYWKGGHSIYRKRYNEVNPLDQCEECGSTRFVVVHHKDGDRANGEISNLVKLCRSCHSKTHKLHKNFGS